MIPPFVHFNPPLSSLSSLLVHMEKRETKYINPFSLSLLVSLCLCTIFPTIFLLLDILSLSPHFTLLLPSLLLLIKQACTHARTCLIILSFTHTHTFDWKVNESWRTMTLFQDPIFMHPIIRIVGLVETRFLCTMCGDIHDNTFVNIFMCE